MIARLAPILMIGLRPVPQPGLATGMAPAPGLERTAIHPPPAGLGVNSLRIGQPAPVDTGPAEAIPQGFIERLGEGKASRGDERPGSTGRATSLLERLIRPEFGPRPRRSEAQSNPRLAQPGAQEVIGPGPCRRLDRRRADARGPIATALMAHGGGWRPRSASSNRMARANARFIANAATVARPVGVSGTTTAPSHWK